MRLNILLAILLAAALLLPTGAQVRAETASGLASKCAQTAVENYAAIQAERQSVAIASAKRREAFGAMLPQVSAASRYTRASGGRQISFDINDLLPSSVIPVDVPPTVIPFLREKEQETKLSVTQPIFTGGGLYQNWRAASQAERASRASLEGVENDYSYTVQKACYDALAARELVSMRGDEVAQAREQLRTVREKHRVQTLPLGEVKRAEASLAAAEADSISASAQAQLALASLNRYIGEPYDTPLPELDGVDVMPALPCPLEQAVENATQSRPELRSLEASLGSVHSSVKASRSSYLPSLVFAAEYGYQGEEYRFGNEDDYSIASFVLNWNLFEGGKRSAKVQQAKLAERQLQFRRVEARDNIRLDVTASWLSAQNQFKSWAAAKRGLDAASEGYRMTEEMFREGMANQLKMLDARSALSGARTAEIASRYAYLTALADLDRSMGTACKGELK